MAERYDREPVQDTNLNSSADGMPMEGRKGGATGAAIRGASSPESARIHDARAERERADEPDTEQLAGHDRTRESTKSTSLSRWLPIMMVLFAIALFLALNSRFTGGRAQSDARPGQQPMSNAAPNAPVNGGALPNGQGSAADPGR